MDTLQTGILQTLLYYDIWQYPLTVDELFAFLPQNSISISDFRRYLQQQGPGDRVVQCRGFYFVRGRTEDIVKQRREKEKRARRMWKMARLSMHIIKRFPFVRGIFVSGELSKNVFTKDGDIDFFIVTEPNRLWISRALLILFKKVFLLNSKKFFCLNYFATSDHLELDERNLFLATEIAHLKPLYNISLYHEYMYANEWIRTYFPNYDPCLLPCSKTNERHSLLQKLFELPFMFLPANALDSYLLGIMDRVWARRYSEFDESLRKRIFRSTKSESRAYPRNYQDRVLALYGEKLRTAGVSD